MTLPGGPMMLELPFATPSLNVLLHAHWSKRRRMRDECAMLIRAQLRRAGVSLAERPSVKMRLAVVRHARRKLDHDNLVGGFKPYLDALRVERLLRDDSPAWLEATYDQGPALPGYPHGVTRIIVEPA